MNLIEQLGYEKAKEAVHRFLNLQLNEGNPDNVLLLDYVINNRVKPEDILLQYRRQNNIFEVGDIAVNSRGDESRLLKIWRVDMCAHNSKMSIADYDAESLGGWSRFHALRHATDEEIKAGKRLEVDDEK